MVSFLLFQLLLKFFQVNYLATFRKLLKITFVVLEAWKAHILVHKAQNISCFFTVKIKEKSSVNFSLGKGSIFSTSGSLINICVDFDISDQLKPFHGPLN